MMTVAQAAKRLGIAPRVVRYRIQRGLLPAELVAPRLYLIPIEAVEIAAGVGKLPSGRKAKPRTD